MSGYKSMGSEMHVTPQEQDLGVSTDLSMLVFFFFFPKLLFFDEKNNRNQMLGMGKKGLETKAEINLGSLLPLVLYAFLFSFSQKEYPERIFNLGDSMIL